MPDLPANIGVLAGAGLKGVIKGLVENFVGSGNIAGLQLSEIVVIALSYFMYKRMGGMAKDVAAGLFIKSVGDIIENFVGGGLPIAQAGTTTAPQRIIVRRIVGRGGGFR